MIQTAYHWEDKGGLGPIQPKEMHLPWTGQVTGEASLQALGHSMVQPKQATDYLHFCDRIVCSIALSIFWKFREDFLKEISSSWWV